MLPATIGIVTLSAILLVFGILSAKRAKRLQRHEIARVAAQLHQAQKSSRDSNQENPSAMAMSGATDANSAKVAGR
jgi:hypothetical protein